MTKSLTEKYLKGTLEDGEYYIAKKDGETTTMYLFDSDTGRRSVKAKRLEVLAPVPSYDECKKLQEQLKDANMIIKGFYWKDTGQASAYCKKWGVK